MTHVRVTLLPSWIGPFGVWMIVGNVVGTSKNQMKLTLVEQAIPYNLV
jgi:hypothetical protein